MGKRAADTRACYDERQMNMEPKIIIEQKLTPFVNRYMVFGAQDNGTKGELLAFAQQKRVTIREKITFFTDESQQSVAFTLRAEKALDIHGRYFVEDAARKRLGVLRKQFKKSLLVSTWQVMDAEEKVLFTVAESSKALAIIRRVVSFIPFVGDLIELVMILLMKYHFDFIDPQTAMKVGKYRKTARFRDIYQLEMAPRAYSQQDWQVFAAMGVALDALQSR